MTIYVPTEVQLLQFSPNLKPFIAALQKEAPKAGIDTPLEWAHFLGQCAIECTQFTVFTEDLRYSADGLARTWPNRYAVDKQAKVKVPNELAKRLGALPTKDEVRQKAIANNAYAGRNGNGDEASGDGYKFRGRGWKQTTFLDNYMPYSMWKYKDDRCVKNPDLLLQPEDSLGSALYFWVRNDLSNFALNDDCLGLTKRINGGTNGYDDGRRDNLNDRLDWTLRGKSIFR